MPSLHQVLIPMSVHPGTPFFPNKLSSIGTKQQMPSLSSPFLPPLFLIMSVCHTNNQAHALPLLLSHLRCLRKAWEWNCTSRISFVSGATRRAFPICSLAPVLQKHHGCLVLTWLPATKPGDQSLDAEGKKIKTQGTHAHKTKNKQQQQNNKKENKKAVKP